MTKQEKLRRAWERLQAASREHSKATDFWHRHGADPAAEHELVDAENVLQRAAAAYGREVQRSRRHV